MDYKEIRKIDVTEHTEKKGQFSYLSWAWAVDKLQELDEKCSWSYSEPSTFPDGSMMVYCTVEAFGKSRTAQLPVLDFKNNPIQNPNAFQINTAMQRALAKAIALHGIGLYIYAGEDLPPDDKQTEKYTQEQLDARQQLYIDIQSAKTKEALDGFAAEAIEALPESMRDEVNDQLDIRYQQIKNGVEPLVKAKWCFPSVNDAIKTYVDFTKYVTNATDAKQLTEWKERNQMKIDGIGDKLKADKHKIVEGVDTGKYPHERLEDSIKKRLTQLSQAPIQEAAE